MDRPSEHWRDDELAQPAVAFFAARAHILRVQAACAGLAAGIATGRRLQGKPRKSHVSPQSWERLLQLKAELGGICSGAAVLVGYGPGDPPAARRSAGATAQLRRFLLDIDSLADRMAEVGAG